MINVEPLNDRSLYEYTLSKQPNIFKSCASSELAAAVASTQINTSLIYQSFDSSANHQTGTFKRLETDIPSNGKRIESSRSLRRRAELGSGLLSPSDDDERVIRRISQIPM